jgi:hypothetical protein
LNKFDFKSLARFYLIPLKCKYFLITNETDFKFLYLPKWLVSKSELLGYNEAIFVHSLVEIKLRIGRLIRPERVGHRPVMQILPNSGMKVNAMKM